MFPRNVTTKVPPIKTQGIKTKLVPFILSSFNWDGRGIWREPFLGSGVVLFNAAPKKAIVGDTNRHIIQFYNDIQTGKLTSRTAREFLSDEGSKLLSSNGEHYYDLRKRFNAEPNSLDFLFLTRACFNGVMRFNSKGGYNVPFCKKPERFRPAQITKICNQIQWVENIVRDKDWKFICQDWQKTLESSNDNDFVYVDPPYVGRSTDYFNTWSDQNADDLARALQNLPCGFAYSMWAENKYRSNGHLKEWFSNYPQRTFQHFYHVGSKEDLRNAMDEALVISPKSAIEHQANSYKKPELPATLALSL